GVGDVVAAAVKTVDRTKAAPLLGGQGKGRVVNVAGSSPGDGSAPSVAFSHLPAGVKRSAHGWCILWPGRDGDGVLQMFCSVTGCSPLFIIGLPGGRIYAVVDLK